MIMRRSVWFFNRSSIPTSISGNASSFSISDLGTPVANWPTGGCAIDTFFKPQHLIFDITLCGGTHFPSFFSPSPSPS
jgi:hypothetical protein